MKFLAYCRFPDIIIYTSGIPEELSVYAHTMARPGSDPDSSQHLKLSSKALVCLFFSMTKEFELYGMLRILKNRIERAF